MSRRRLSGLLALFMGLSRLACSQDAATPGGLDAAALEAFVDGYMGAYLEDAHIAGATVAVVEGESLVFAKGYGLKNVSEREPVDAGRTLFRIGSVSKLFVWTAVMQLVESGRLDLEADLNTYLEDLTVPEAFDGAVTMRQLMTHTAGFDERVLGLFAADESALRPLGDVLRDELPGRVRPGNDLTSYSNHGTALAMYVVEQISGVPWETYVTRNLLEPLQMRHTSFAQPLPPSLALDLSEGYRFHGGDLVAAPFELVPLAPVGAVSATATDMARFVSAHLRLGRLGEATILGEASARRMQTTLFRHHPGLNGMAHGFMEMDWNGERILGHGGDTELFHTLFAFLPERDIGVFASFNTVGADYTRFLHEFVEWRFPKGPLVESPPDSTIDLGRFAGRYRVTRYPHYTIAKLSALASTLDVRADGDHLVLMGERNRAFVLESGLLFRERGGRSTIAFRAQDDGRISHLFLGEIPVIAFERAPTVESPNLVLAVVGGGLSIVLFALVFWPAAAAARWHYGARLTREERVPTLGRWSVWLASGALVAFVAGLSTVLANPMDVVYGIRGTAGVLFWLPVIAVGLTALALVGAVQSWRARRGSFVGRVAFTVVVLALSSLLWQLLVWNLLGFHY